MNADNNEVGALLERVFGTYGALTSYMDEGVVISRSPRTFVPDDLIDELEAQPGCPTASQMARVQTPDPNYLSSHSTFFQTLFVRPDRFRFSFQRPHAWPPDTKEASRFVCGSDGSRSYIWTQYDDDQPPQLDLRSELEQVIREAAGISSGSAPSSAALLLGRRRRSLLSLPSEMVDDGTVDGVACKVVRWVDEDREVRWFIDPSTWLVRRIINVHVDTSVFGRSVKFFKEETRRAIRVNEPIGMSQFDVPAGGDRTNGA